jgi:hypothetical protein
MISMPRSCGVQLIKVTDHSWSRKPVITPAEIPLQIPHRLLTSNKTDLSQTSGLSLGLEQAQDVILTDCTTQRMLVWMLSLSKRGRTHSTQSERRTGSLDVADDRTGLVLKEFDANLGNTTARACRLLLVYFPLLSVC